MAHLKNLIRSPQQSKEASKLTITKTKLRRLSMTKKSFALKKMSKTLLCKPSRNHLVADKCLPPICRLNEELLEKLAQPMRDNMNLGFYDATNVDKFIDDVLEYKKLIFRAKCLIYCLPGSLMSMISKGLYRSPRRRFS